MDATMMKMMPTTELHSTEIGAKANAKAPPAPRITTQIHHAGHNFSVYVGVDVGAKGVEEDMLLGYGTSLHGPL
ncbi:hypothetical protein GCM10009861_11640 [Neomicrococcus aestuarii]